MNNDKNNIRKIYFIEETKAEDVIFLSGEIFKKEG